MNSNFPCFSPAVPGADPFQQRQNVIQLFQQNSVRQFRHPGGIRHQPALLPRQLSFPSDSRRHRDPIRSDQDPPAEIPHPAPAIPENQHRQKTEPRIQNVPKLVCQVHKNANSQPGAQHQYGSDRCPPAFSGMDPKPYRLCRKPWPRQCPECVIAGVWTVPSPPRDCAEALAVLTVYQQAAADNPQAAYLSGGDLFGHTGGAFHTDTAGNNIHSLSGACCPLQELP